MKPFLVIGRVGDKSLHPGWLLGAEPNFDVFLSYFGDEPDKFRDQATYYEQVKGGKWPILHRIITEHWDLISRYSAVWLPDDDLLTNAHDINKMFAFMQAFDLSLAQPALSLDSYFSHSSLLQQTNSVLRFTNFVEVMAPIFSAEALKQLRNTFGESPSGWGLDNLWPLLLDNSNKRKIAILDAVPVVHTRPLGGELYKKNPELSPERDVEKLMQQYGDLNIGRKSFKNKFRIYAEVNLTLNSSDLSAFVKGKMYRLLAKHRSSRVKKYSA